MYSRLQVTLIALLIALFAAPTIAGLKPATHTGFYIGFGIGWGSLKMELDDEDDNLSFITDAESGGAGSFRIGGALSQKLLLGAEGNSWVKDYEIEYGGGTSEASVVISNLALALTYYPAEQFFIKGGPAIAQATLEFDVPGTIFAGKVEDTGSGLMVGAGGEFRITNKFAIVPSAQWTWQAFEDYKINVFSLTLGVGWFW